MRQETLSAFLRQRLVLALVLSLSAYGCAHTGAPPRGMVIQGPAGGNADSDTAPALQILITRNFLYGTHTALRLNVPPRETLFWDPSGIYGVFHDQDDVALFGDLIPPDLVRINDLIVKRAPSLEHYWRYARRTLDSGMEVFVWRLDEERAAQLYDLFLAGSRAGSNQPGFRTETYTLLCATAVSRFLRNHAANIVSVDEVYFWPHNLARHLRAQEPDVLIVFDAENGTVRYQKKASLARY